MYSRKIKLIRALVESGKLSSSELMRKLRISQRTLRAEIKEINDILKKENVSIYSSSIGGYYIKKEEKAAIQKKLNGMINQSKQVIFPETPNERFLFGFTWLFFLEEPVSIQKAAEKLYVSRTAMLQTKKQIQDVIRWYHGIFLETGNRGMWINGEEEIKRHALSEVINYWTYGSILMERVITFLFGSEKYRHYITFYRVLPKMLIEHGYRLIDKGFEGLSLDIFISLMRNEYGFKLPDEEGMYQRNFCIDEVCDFLEQMGYTVPNNEKAYFERCLRAKRVLYASGVTYEVSEEYAEVTDDFLNMIDKKYHTDYHKNQELFYKLSVHIMKMIWRIRQGYFETNTILKDIMDNYGKEVEMADGINPILWERYNLTANIHEICYIAVYLRAYSNRRLKVIILCDMGESIADNMMRQIIDYCGEKIEIIDKMSLAEYSLNPIPVDLLISVSRIYNVELPERTEVIYVDYLLKEENLKKIQEFLLTNKQNE